MPPIDKPFIVHIGRHKSGTSALQRTLHKNYDALCEQGFLYPKRCRSEPAHHRISSHFRPPERKRFSPEETRKAIKALRDEATCFDGTIILSSEGFQNCAPDTLTRLFPPEQTQIVVYLREQYAYAQSAYCQSVQGDTVSKTFEEHLLGFTSNYVGFLKRWEVKFKPRQLSVRIYDRARLIDGDIIDDFFSTCGMKLGNVEKPAATSNVSIGGPLLEFKRAVNSTGIPREELSRVKTYKVLAQVARSDARYRAKPTASEGAVSRFREQFREINLGLSKKYFDGSEIFSYSSPAPVQNTSFEDIEGVLECIKENMGEPVLDLIRQVPSSRVTDPTAKMIRDYIG